MNTYADNAQELFLCEGYAREKDDVWGQAAVLLLAMTRT